MSEVKNPFANKVEVKPATAREAVVEFIKANEKGEKALSQIIDNPTQENKLPRIELERRLASIRRVLQSEISNRQLNKLMPEIQKILQ